MLSIALSVSFICLLYSFYSFLTIASSVRFIYSVYVYFYFICLSFCLFVYFIFFYLSAKPFYKSICLSIYLFSYLFVYDLFTFSHINRRKKMIVAKTPVSRKSFSILIIFHEDTTICVELER